jgi:hypothetical protein
VAQGSTTEWLKESVFGMDPSTPRLEVLKANLWAIPVVALIAAALMAAGAFALRFAPPADHALSFDANRFGPPQVGLVGRRKFSWPVFSMSVGEKAVLVTLISIIFAEFLPGVDATAFQMTVALGTVVVLNAVISSWQARRGLEWRAATVEFASIVVVNGAIVLTIAELARWTDASLSLVSALFYGLLLSLLITLYDRYQHQRVWWMLQNPGGFDGPRREVRAAMG